MLMAVRNFVGMSLGDYSVSMQAWCRTMVGTSAKLVAGWQLTSHLKPVGHHLLDELNGELSLDGGHNGVDDDVTTVHHAHSYVLTVARIEY